MGLIRDFVFGKETNVATLTHAEQVEFNALDQAVGMACLAASVVEKGAAALTRIRDGQLWRDVANSWDDYLTRHSLSARRANQIIHAFKIKTDFSEKTGTVVPELSERSMRPMAGMTTDEAVETLSLAAADAEGITPASIRRAVSQKKSKGVKVPKSVRMPVPGAIIVIEWNRKGVTTGFDGIVAMQKGIAVLQKRVDDAAAQRRKQAG